MLLLRVALALSLSRVGLGPWAEVQQGDESWGGGRQTFLPREGGSESLFRGDPHRLG